MSGYWECIWVAKLAYGAWLERENGFCCWERLDGGRVVGRGEVRPAVVIALGPSRPEPWYGWGLSWLEGVGEDCCFMGRLGLGGDWYGAFAGWRGCWERYGRRPRELAAVSSSLKRSRRSMSKTGCHRCGSFESSCCCATGLVRLGSTGRSDCCDNGDCDSKGWLR